MTHDWAGLDHALHPAFPPWASTWRNQTGHSLWKCAPGEWHTVKGPRPQLEPGAAAERTRPLNMGCPLSGNPHRLRFESGMAQHCRAAGVARLRSSCHNYRILCDRSYRYVLQVFPTEGLEEVLFFLIRLLVLDFWAGLKNECCILKTNRVLCCCFGVWLPVCSVLNLAELLHRALAETESLRFIFYRGIRTAGADTRRSGDGGSKLSSAAMVEQWRSGAGPDTTLVEIRGNCSELMKTWHCPWCWSSRHFGHCVVFSCQFLYVCTSITFPLHDQSDNMYFFFLQNCEVELSLMVMSFCGRCTVHGCWAILTVKNEEIGGCFTSQELAWLHAQS